MISRIVVLDDGQHYRGKTVALFFISSRLISLRSAAGLEEKEEEERGDYCQCGDINRTEANGSTMDHIIGHLKMSKRN